MACKERLAGLIAYNSLIRWTKTMRIPGGIGDSCPLPELGRPQSIALREMLPPPAHLK